MRLLDQIPNQIQKHSYFAHFVIQMPQNEHLNGKQTSPESAKSVIHLDRDQYKENIQNVDISLLFPTNAAK